MTHRSCLHKPDEYPQSLMLCTIIPIHDVLGMAGTDLGYLLTAAVADGIVADTQYL